MNVEEKALKLIEDSLNKKCNGLECKVVKNNIDLRLEIIRLNRQIDLMADFIYKIWCDYPGSIFYKLKKVGFDESKCGFCKHSDRMCKDCLKQYFKNKVKE